MLELTTSAAERLCAALTESSGQDDTCIRIVVAEDDVHLAIDEQREGDTTIKHEDKVLVVLDSVAANVLEDRKIDYDQEASQFVFV